MSKLEPSDIRALHEGLFAEGLAANTIRIIHLTLHHALKDAMARGLIARNVCELIKSPKATKREMHPLTQSEARVLTGRTNRFRALWVVALATGMRFGELVALRWSDVNFAKGTLAVRYSAHWEKGLGMVVKQPKTEAGVRTILLNQHVLVELKSHRAAQHQERLLAGELWIDNGIVFCNEVGQMYYHHRIHDHFKKALRESGLPDIHLHDLRHTAATLLLEAGINLKVVSEILGHASTAVTMTIYAHVTRTMQEQAAQAMGDILFG